MAPRGSGDPAYHHTGGTEQEAPSTNTGAARAHLGGAPGSRYAARPLAPMLPFTPVLPLTPVVLLTLTQEQPIFLPAAKGSRVPSPDLPPMPSVTSGTSFHLPVPGWRRAAWQEFLKVN